MNTTVNAMTAEQRKQARHALGLPNKRQCSYRNRFVCQENDPHWADMVAKGWAKMRAADSLPFGGCAMFWLTKAGAQLALDKREKLDPEDFPE